MAVKRLAPFVSATKTAFWSRWERPVIILLAVLLIASFFFKSQTEHSNPAPKG